MAAPAGGTGLKAKGKCQIICASADYNDMIYATTPEETEALVSDRIAQQTEELARLTHKRDALAKKTS